MNDCTQKLLPKLILIIPSLFVSCAFYYFINVYSFRSIGKTPYFSNLTRFIASIPNKNIYQRTPTKIDELKYF